MEYVPHTYQKHAIDFIKANSAAGLFLDMGLGKTSCTLTAVNDLLYENLEPGPVLVIAPLRVAQSTWEQEAGKWNHLRHLTFSKVLGGLPQRVRALRKRADIYIVNRENVCWLVDYYGAKWPFQTVVIDELSSFKNSRSQRFRALKRIRPKIRRIIGLTGTPAPKGLIDLWAQLYLLDGGERLGKTLGGYREKYFNAGRRNGYVIFDWIPKKGAPEKIYGRIADICVSMQAKDWLELPGRQNIIKRVELPPAVRSEYEELEKEAFLEAEEGSIVANGKADLTNKLSQYANGAVYTDDGGYITVHDEKLKELELLVEEANGKPVLVYYAYRHDEERIMEYLKGYEPRKLKDEEQVEAWNRGGIKVLLAHPKSAGHGLNMQSGGHIIIWFGLSFDLELYMQANARLDRQGQTECVRVYHIITGNTRDEDYLPVLDGKAVTQQVLKDALKARVETYGL